MSTVAQTPHGARICSGREQCSTAGIETETTAMTASLSFVGSAATLEVKNASGEELAAPALYVVSGTGEHVDGSVVGAVPIADGARATFQVTFPNQVTSKTIGLVILLFGDSNYGAFAPAPAD